MTPVFGTQLGMRFVYIPIYIENNARGDANPHKISFVSHGASEDTELAWMGRPHIPHHDSGWRKPADINLISLYKISIGIDRIANSKNRFFVINISKAVKPDGIPFTLQHVVELVRESARLTFPDTDTSKVVFKLIEKKQKNQQNRVDGRF